MLYNINSELVRIKSKVEIPVSHEYELYMPIDMYEKYKKEWEKFYILIYHHTVYQDRRYDDSRGYVNEGVDSIETFEYDVEYETIKITELFKDRIGFIGYNGSEIYNSLKNVMGLLAEQLNELVEFQKSLRDLVSGYGCVEVDEDINIGKAIIPKGAKFIYEGKSKKIFVNGFSTYIKSPNMNPNYNPEDEIEF